MVWLYIENCKPPVRADYRCFDRSLPKRYHGRACAGVLFCVDGADSVVPGLYFAADDSGAEEWCGLLGQKYRTEDVYAWAPQPAPAPIVRPQTLARMLTLPDGEFARLLENCR